MTGVSRLIALVCGLLISGVAWCEGDPAAGAIKSETCRGCHAIEDYKNVYPTYSVPRLAGQSPAYIVVALKAYRSGERSHATMQSHAKTMSDQDMEDIAAFLATQDGGE